MRRFILALLVGVLSVPLLEAATAADTPERIYVNSASGKDRNSGSRTRPVRTLSAAIELLPDPLERSVTIEIASGDYETTGGKGMPDHTLQLMRRMRPDVEVRIVGQQDAKDRQPVFAWKGGRAVIHVTEGRWRFESVQIGSGSTRQRRGIQVAAPAHVTLKDVTFRTRSHSGEGILVHRGGWVSLLGRIHLNEHLHEAAEDETFCGIVATDHGCVKFEERDGAHLDMGNGSLSASNYGVIRLGCETARITSWGRQSNNLAVNNGGRIDLHGTTTTLRAVQKENTPIGPEHDGHILAEDAHIIIEGENECAITLQKASTFTCNDIELRGKFRKTLWTMSGSIFVGRFLTDVTQIEAHTGAGVYLEKVDGQVRGPVIATSGGTIALPDGTVVREKRSK